MATLAEMVRVRTDLDEADLDWLQRLVGEWQLLADLSFADLILRVPLGGRTDAPEFLTAAQIRPTTGPTAYVDDLIGSVLAADDDLALRTAWTEGRIFREGDPVWRGGLPVREEAVPVRHGDHLVGVLHRVTNLVTARTPSRLELSYLQAAGELAQMVADGAFPYPGGSEGPDVGMRVGDGLIRLGPDGCVVYASPNAQSALRRLGQTGDLAGRELAAVLARTLARRRTVDRAGLAVAEGRSPGTGELEGPGAVVQLRSYPLRSGSRSLGALILLRDVSELRHRDRLLLTKDATIREIHHRVKNNLQTVAALLRLQARRVDAGEARRVLEESVRRVSAIALVHETLSQALEEEVDFDEVADRVLGMVSDVSGADDVRVQRIGSFGVLPAVVATPLALVLTELVQNAVEHAFADRAGGQVDVVASRSSTWLDVRVRDDGAGLPEGFRIEDSPRLGLQIVRALVVGELHGAIAMSRRREAGTEAVLRLPLDVGPSR